jgi:hypothetical protein
MKSLQRGYTIVHVHSSRRRTTIISELRLGEEDNHRLVGGDRSVTHSLHHYLIWICQCQDTVTLVRDTHLTTPLCPPFPSMQMTQDITQSFSETLPDLQIGAYRPMNDPVQTYPASRTSMARSPSAYKLFSTYSPTSHSVNEETSPLR